MTIKKGNYTIIEDSKNQNIAHNTKEVITFDDYNSLKNRVGFFSAPK